MYRRPCVAGIARISGLSMMQISEKCVCLSVRTSDNPHFFPWRLETAFYDVIVCSFSEKNIVSKCLFSRSRHLFIII